MQNKSDFLVAAFLGNVDRLLITETYKDSIFLRSQFYFNDYNLYYRHDHMLMVVALVYVLHDIRTRIAECEVLSNTFKGLVVELSLNFSKNGYWSASTVLIEKSKKDSIRVLSSCIDQNIKIYESIILIGRL